MADQQNITASGLPNFALIAAVASDRAIGYQNDLPWSSGTIPTDMRFFELCTQHINHHNIALFPNEEPQSEFGEPRNVVIMGRLTWESMPVFVRPFKNRICIVVSRNPELKLEMKNEDLRKYTHVAGSLEQALELSASKVSKDGAVYVIGGSHLYKEALVLPNCKAMLLTELFDHSPFQADTFFPEYKGESFDWGDGINLTLEALRWMDKHPITRRRFPVLTSADIQTDAKGEFARENNICYRFMLYRRN